MLFYVTLNLRSGDNGWLKRGGLWKVWHALLNFRAYYLNLAKTISRILNVLNNIVAAFHNKALFVDITLHCTLLGRNRHNIVVSIMNGLNSYTPKGSDLSKTAFFFLNSIR